MAARAVVFPLFLLLLAPFRPYGKFSSVVKIGTTPSLVAPTSGDLFKDFDLVEGSLEVVLCRLLDLQCHKGVVLDVLCQPHSREMAPAQLLQDNISIQVSFPI
eukprot:TRINITY_DN16670_c0_g2_i1.p3 TRINITY_DN16670_c0_g2~~TRINITY_DN16670_c0_g2_i1.p3  ORF type:complete len:103 (+),score=5.26 TRINITY_DN16670_c0_g2_i1:3-311(+)